MSFLAIRHLEQHFRTRLGARWHQFFDHGGELTLVLTQQPRLPSGNHAFLVSTINDLSLGFGVVRVLSPAAVRVRMRRQPVLSDSDRAIHSSRHP